jgi:hypothetical protein
MDSRLDDASSLASMYLGGQVDLRDFTPLYYIVALPGIKARLYLGLSPEPFLSGVPASWDAKTAFSSLLHAHLGHRDEASELLAEYVVRRPSIATEEDGTIAVVDIGYLEAAVLVGHLAAAEVLLSRLSSPRFYVLGALTPTCASRHLGDAAALLGRPEEARRHYLDAIEACTEMPFRPELALSRLELAELLLEHYSDEKKAAKEHLDFAIGEFREMKMQPSLERALRHKEILKA